MTKQMDWITSPKFLGKPYHRYDKGRTFFLRLDLWIHIIFRCAYVDRFKLEWSRPARDDHLRESSLQRDTAFLETWRRARLNPRPRGETKQLFTSEKQMFCESVQRAARLM